jgi:heptosyltransferase-2
VTRSLLIAPQWIGDAVMSEPLVARLAARGERLTVAALPWVAPVYRAMPAVERVEELPFAHGRLDWAARRRLGLQWRGRYDRAYVLPNSIKAALLPWFAQVPVRIGYQGEGRPLLLTERLPNPEGRPPMVAFYSRLAGPLGEADAASRPLLQIASERIEAVCADQGLLRRRYFCFAPGAEYGPAKCWPAAHYAALAASLYQRYRLPVLLLGSAKERALCEGIASEAEEAAPGACRVLCGNLSLIDAMTLIAGARGMASNDSGLMHIAAAFGLPQVALFGSTSPEHTPPLNPQARVLWLKDELGLDCAPCFERQCRYGHTRCLAELSPARAEAALAEVLPPTTGLPASGPSVEFVTEALMRDALLSARTSVWSWDILGGALSNVDTSAVLLGYAPGEIASHQSAWDQLIHPDDRAPNHEAYLRHARGELPIYESEYRARAKDGGWRWISERGRIVSRTEDGEPARMVGTLSDITSLLELEEARRDRLRAEAANQAKTEFVSKVSHELRTPMNAVLGFAQLLESDTAEPLGSRQRRRVQLIRESSEHLLRMIDDLLDLTRIEAGHLRVHPAEVQLVDLVQGCAEMLEGPARDAGVRLVLPDPATPCQAWADADRLRQVLLNLMSNAVKYNRPGGTVTVLLQPREDRVLIKVRDDGLGIATEALDQLFEPFNRLGRQHGPIEGSGIGLAVTRGLVQGMGGQITVRSALGTGSQFCVSLPQRAPDQSTSLPT